MHPPGEELRRSIGLILGSAMDETILRELPFAMAPVQVDTPFGPQALFQGLRSDGVRVLVLYRHGLPHAHLPHTINFRAQAWALRSLGCQALVLNSSVGVLTQDVPLFTPMLATDLLMPENRLPDGSVCTLFTPEAMAKSPEVRTQAGHLVLSEGIFSPHLQAQLRTLGVAHPTADGSLVFVYAPGPRTKTAAENRYWAAMGGHVNSMSLGPEAVLACEAGIPCAALVVGHKPSPGAQNKTTPGKQLTSEGLSTSLIQSRQATEAVLLAFLTQGQPVPSGNLIYRFQPGP